ncbi:putative terpene cyclase [Cladorrhinum samala]|uniref:Terpene synthase n=1 Tax=Cladorrhinum samala TaxID=585594 RepID=A0AAV9HK02_9PEZI|nr:putative terpene cyclase [Cladorrhinum samala]
MTCQLPIQFAPYQPEPKTAAAATKTPKDHPLRAIAPPSALPEPPLHPDHEEIDREVISYLVKTWEWPSERTKKGFVSWNLSEVVLFMFPTGEKHRVKLACELLLLGFLMDDNFDSHTFEHNTFVVSRLQSFLSSPSTFTPQTTIDRMHSDLFSRFLEIPCSHSILETYLSMLLCHCDDSRGKTSTMGSYLAFREVDVGMPICSELMYWADPCLLGLGREQREGVLRPLERIANYHVSILNDVFSFEREWKAAQEQEEGAALVNGVAVLAGEVGLGVGAARVLCLALVRGWEKEFLEMVAGLDLDDNGKDAELMRRAVKGIERRMSGAEAFSWRTRRYL